MKRQRNTGQMKEILHKRKRNTAQMHRSQNKLRGNRQTN